MFVLAIALIVTLVQSFARKVGWGDDPQKRVDTAVRLFQERCSEYGGRAEDDNGVDVPECVVRLWGSEYGISIISLDPWDVKDQTGLELTSGRFDRGAANDELRECRESNSFERSVVRMERRSGWGETARPPTIARYSRRYGVCEDF
ncbi:MAG TPA: hypothetical protein VGM91_19395 [Conexibacter sp.]|jgi:hypothetical protein